MMLLVNCLTCLLGLVWLAEANDYAQENSAASVTAQQIERLSQELRKQLQGEEELSQQLLDTVTADAAGDMIEHLVAMLSDPRYQADPQMLKAAMVKFIEEPRFRLETMPNGARTGKRVKAPAKLLDLIKSDITANEKKMVLDHVLVKLHRRKDDLAALAIANENQIAEAQAAVNFLFNPGLGEVRHSLAEEELRGEDILNREVKIEGADVTEEQDRIPRQFQQKVLRRRGKGQRGGATGRRVKQAGQRRNKGFGQLRQGKNQQGRPGEKSQLLVITRDQQGRGVVEPVQQFQQVPSNQVLPPAFAQNNINFPSRPQQSLRQQALGRPNAQSFQSSRPQSSQSSRPQTSRASRPQSFQSSQGSRPKSAQVAKPQSFQSSQGSRPKSPQVGKPQSFQSSQGSRPKSPQVARPQSSNRPQASGVQPPSISFPDQDQPPRSSGVRRQQKSDGEEEKNVGFPDSFGIAGVDFPTFDHHEMPPTSFSCSGLVNGGYYSDVEAECQMFHLCADDGTGGNKKFSFLCPNGTLFNQETLVCDSWFNVDCSDGTVDLLAELNNSLDAERTFITLELEVTDPIDDYPWRNREENF